MLDPGKKANILYDVAPSKLCEWTLGR